MHRVTLADRKGGILRGTAGNSCTGLRISRYAAGKLAGLDKKLSRSLDQDVQLGSSPLELSKSPVGPLSEASRYAARSQTKVCVWESLLLLLAPHPGQNVTAHGWPLLLLISSSTHGPTKKPDELLITTHGMNTCVPEHSLGLTTHLHLRGLPILRLDHRRRCCAT